MYCCLVNTKSTMAPWNRGHQLPVVGEVHGGMVAVGNYASPFMEDDAMSGFSHLVFDKFPHVLIICAIAVSHVIAASDEPRDHAAVLAVKKMDCPAESAPAVLAISKIPGVKSVAVDYKTGTLKIIPKPNAFPSPAAIWEAAERTNLEPIRLATAHGMYESKPRRQ